MVGANIQPAEATGGSPLLGLTPELRNTIYHYALVEAKPIHVQSLKKSPIPSLLRTCRQIRWEAFAIFLQDNAFVVAVEDLWGGARGFDLFDWLYMLGGDRASLIKDLEVKFSEHDGHVPDFSRCIGSCWFSMSERTGRLAAEVLCRRLQNAGVRLKSIRCMKVGGKGLAGQTDSTVRCAAFRCVWSLAVEDELVTATDDK